jgi:hypothetical protein
VGPLHDRLEVTAHCNNMSDPIIDYQSAANNPGGLPTAEKDFKSEKVFEAAGTVEVSDADNVYDGAEGIPTAEEYNTLRKISAPMP